MSLIDKLKKNSTIKDTAILTESKFFGVKDLIQTAVPALNVALSGRLDGGLTPGLTVFAGPSKHFKTEISLSFRKKIQIYYSYVYNENVCTINSEDKSILLDQKTFSVLKQNFKKISKNILNKK